ncbi:unnamed protein product [Arctia plantaginis]|uniref:Uncharacterized protein n=1 Tax=Arctia plantaginis TaxID=874455 RepID=A0A8S0ZKD0_ARCPL|nr:unnamed protein product [Arctia plantaginis]
MGKGKGKGKGMGMGKGKGNDKAHTGRRVHKGKGNKGRKVRKVHMAHRGHKVHMAHMGHKDHTGRRGKVHKDRKGRKARKGRKDHKDHRGHKGKDSTARMVHTGIHMDIPPFSYYRHNFFANRRNLHCTVAPYVHQQTAQTGNLTRQALQRISKL